LEILASRSSWLDDPANPVEIRSDLSDLKSLVADLNAGKVDWLVILNANPIYNAPADLNFANAFEKGEGDCAFRLALG
jgi:hypothetical protein